MYKNTIIFVVAFLTSLSLFAQNGTLKGTVTDAVTGETIPMANIVIKSDGLTILGGASDFDGNFTIKPITPGSYTVEVSFIGYATLRQTNVLISPDKITFSDYQLSLEANVLTEVQIIEYDVPLIDPDKSGSTKTKEQITALPTRNVQNVAATTAGVYQGDSDGALNVRGSRSDATAYYVDGIKIVGSTNTIPQAAIDQMTVVTGGLPAKYGDATGGIISIVTSGPSRVTRGGLEIQTSKFLDPYNWNLAAFNLSGPIWRKRDEDRTPVLSYLISSEYTYKADYDPSAIGVPVLNEDVLESLEQNPSIFLVNEPYEGPEYLNPSTTYNDNAGNFLDSNDWTMSDIYQNKSSQDLKLQAKLTLAVTKDIDFIVGGNTRLQGYHNGSWTAQLLNSSSNYLNKINSSNYYARIQHRLSGDDGGTVNNLFYTLQADYSSYSRNIEHQDHGKNFWLYNYVGKFTPEIDNETLTNFSAQIPQTWSTYDVYVLDEDGNRIPDGDGWLTEEHTGVLVQNYETLGFEASDANPLLANYTQQYYDYLDENADFVGAFDSEGNPIGDGVADWKPSINHIYNNALLNGDGPSGINSLWYNVGRPMSFYLDERQNRLSFTGSASADIGNHAISFGFEYEKKTDREYYIGTSPLWSRARQLANRHLYGFEEYIINDELQNSHPNGDDVLLISEVYYQTEDNESYSTFGKNIREALGYGVNDLVFVDELDPELITLDMFSADELFNQDDDYLSYFGYDYLGNVINEPVSMDDFFNETDENGDYKRRIGPFQPLYSAAYIQDKFSFDDIVFNVGVRVDRYDANQQVLKDKYSLYPTITRSELGGEIPEFADYEHPSNIGGDYVVYANSITDQTVIMGYRDGDDWYNVEGTQVTDPAALDAGVGVTPFLTDPNHNSEDNYGLTEDAFEDYTPQISVMPRISFNFPISDEALFFAHYDVLTQRPSGLRSRTDPLDYLFLAANANYDINNGNLKPEKTTDYEVGFKQAISKYSAITISAFYRELDDMVQITRVAGAYPMPYTHFDNIDFGTVKGLSFGYDLRRTNNVQLTATYTLQFADGTGSSSTTAATLVNNGFPNLRTTLPLDFDQRHNISTNIDYRFGFGSRYNGPIIFGRQLLEGVGANLLIAAGSGTPYSQQTEATEQAKYGIPIRTTLEGSVNGARKPWTFRADLRVNKDIKIQMSEDRDLKMDVYMLVENLFNMANVMSVYRYTGNPDDDGYLSSSTGEDDALENTLDPAAFYDQYSIKVNNPNNYTRPRLIKLGMKVNF